MDLDKLTNNDTPAPVTVEDQMNESNQADVGSTSIENTTSKRGGKAGRGGSKAGVGRGGSKAGNKGKNGTDTGSQNGTGNGTSGSSSSIPIPAPTFPLARVSRIVKADPDIQTVSKDAIWTIAVATEMFIKHLTDSLIAKTKLEKKKIASYDELAAVVESQEEFDFLQEVIPEPIQAQEAFAMRKELQEQNYQRAVGLLIDEDSDEEEDEEDTAAVTVEGQEEVEDGEGEKNQSEQIIEPVEQNESQAKGQKKSTKGKSKKTKDADAPIEEVGDVSVTSKSGKGGKGGRKSTSKAAQPTTQQNDGDQIMQDV